MRDETPTTSSADNRAGPYRWSVVVILMIGYFFAFLDRTIIGLMVAPIQADLQISDTQMSLLMGIAFVLLYSVAAIPIGYLADRASRKRIITIGAAVWCLMTAACGLATSFAQLFAARIMVGLGEATLTAPATSIISDYFGPRRIGRALSIFNLGIAGGAGLSLVLGGSLIAWISTATPEDLGPLSAFAPWQIIFIVIGILGLSFVVLMGFVREPKRTGRAKPSRADSAPLSLAQTAQYFRQNARLYSCHFGAMTMITLYSFAVIGWMPTYLIRTHGWSAAEAGLRYGTVAALTSVVGMITAGIVMDALRARGLKTAPWWVILMGIAVFAPGLVVATLFENPTLTLAAAAFGVFGSSMAGIAAPTALMLASPNEVRATATSLYILTINIGGAATAPTFVALVTDQVFEDPQMIGASMSIVNAAAWLLGSGIAIAGLSAFKRKVS